MQASRSALSRAGSAGWEVSGAPRHGFRTRRSVPRAGIALPIALAAIVTIGALITGVCFAAMQEYRIGRNTLISQQASVAAEVGILSVLSSWTAERTASTKVGQTVKLTRESADAAVVQNGAVVEVQYTRVGPTNFLLTSTAVAGGQNLGARSVRRVSVVLGLDIPELPIQGALTVRGNVNATGAATISGNDTTPPGWNDCLPAGSPRAGLVVGDSAANVAPAGECAGYKCLYGAPAIADSSLYSDSLTYKNFGGFSYDSLTKLAAAEKIYINGSTIDQRKPLFNSDGSCNKADPRNWGDTSHVAGPVGCRDYYPVVWLKGTEKNWTVSNFGGQGILLVDGNVTFNGVFSYKGLIIVQGTVSFAGSENAPRIIGALMAMNRKNGTHTIQGTALVRFSRCTVQAVTSRLAAVRSIRYRAWTDMFF